MRQIRAALAGFLVGMAVAAAGYAAEAVGETRDRPLGPGLVTVDMTIDRSKFSLDRIDVHSGTTVRFVVRNDDPINHELVVGDEAVHAVHRNGTELEHPPVPGEVTLGPDELGVTFLEFDEPGTYEFACHLPRHYAYGMRGVVVVS